MSLPSSEQNENEPGSNHKPEHGNAPRPMAEAAEPVSPLSIIPIAPMHWRMLAFLLDGVLVTLFACMLLTKVLLPEYHPVGYGQLYSEIEAFGVSANQALESGEPQPALLDSLLAAAQNSEEIRDMFVYITEIFALCVLLYFVLCERFMAGGSVGKSMLRLRVISLNTGRPPSIWESFLRGLIKVCLLVMPAFVVVIGCLLPFTNRMRRAAHDWLARTLVVSDTGGYVPHVTRSRKRDEEDDDNY